MRLAIPVLLLLVLAPVGLLAEDADVEARRLLEAKQRERESAAGRIRALAAKIGDGRDSARRRLSWEKARGSAREWIFDRKAFPDIDGPIYGPQEGYEEAMRRAKLAIHAYSGLRGALDRSLAPLRRIGPEDAAHLRKEHRDAVTSCARLAAEIPGGDRDEPPEIPRLAWILLDIAEGRWSAARAAYRDVPEGWVKLCVFEAYGRALLARNARDAAGMGAPAVRALDGLNRYRMALGISPIAHDARLVRMAQAHSHEMMKMGYLGHESPVTKNRTQTMRARNAGYEGSVSECVSGRSSPASAIETWKWDGGHHRIMVHYRFGQVGLSHRGPATFEAGDERKSMPAPIRY